ncbi:hypothetical protein MBLNU457_g2821t1 [Dothideomycetes sp. NU457]
MHHAHDLSITEKQAINQEIDFNTYYLALEPYAQRNTKHYTIYPPGVPKDCLDVADGIHGYLLTWACAPDETDHQTEAFDYLDPWLDRETEEAQELRWLLAGVGNEQAAHLTVPSEYVVLS